MKSMHRVGGIVALLLSVVTALAAPAGVADERVAHDSVNAVVLRAANDLERPPSAQELAFQSARTLLLEAGLPFEPALLLQDNWRKTVGPQLDQLWEMKRDLRNPGRLAGVQIADVLHIRGTVTIEAETVIIANEIRFDHGPLEIKGNHPIHLFIRGAVRGRDGNSVITIDTSGAPGHDGTPGHTGAAGLAGSDAPAGENGTCEGALHGQHGTAGQPGATGGTGTAGTDGTRGIDAQPIMVSIPDGDMNRWVVRAQGGDGGNGGDGGPGGAGGAGGMGGSGGRGATCPGCKLGRAGDGGPGGRAGNGGAGGRGGNAGDGGNGAAVSVSFPPGFDFGRVDMPGGAGSSGRPGSGGQGSRGGPVGPGGLSGEPGSAACGTSNRGAHGPVGPYGGHGPHGRHGRHGEHGRPGGGLTISGHRSVCITPLIPVRWPRTAAGSKPGTAPN